MIKFITGKIYFCRSTCDHEAIFKYKIERRSEKSVWIEDMQTGLVQRKTVKIWYDDTKEAVWPEGRYSMAPILTAEKIAA